MDKFKQYGKVVDHFVDVPKHFALVRYNLISEAAGALEGLSRETINGRTLKVMLHYRVILRSFILAKCMFNHCIYNKNQGSFCGAYKQCMGWFITS